MKVMRLRSIRLSVGQKEEIDCELERLTAIFRASRRTKKVLEREVEGHPGRLNYIEMIDRAPMNRYDTAALRFHARHRFIR